MENLENEIFELSGINDKITKDYIQIEMDGAPFAVRTFGINDASDAEPKKTLVLIHGFLASSIFWYKVIGPLSKKYNIVMFDIMSWGLNTRPKECSGMDSEEAAEAWQLEWFEKVINKLNLPERFLLCGHSWGGWLVSLYASQHPDRIEALFLNSPAGLMPYDPATYEPYKFLDYNDLHRIVPRDFCAKEL